MSTALLDSVRQETAEALLTVHQSTDGAQAGEVSFRDWIPRSERKQCQRLFVASSVAGVTRYVAKVPLDPDDAMVDREWEVLSGPVGTDLPRPRAVRKLDRGFVMTYVPSRDFPEALGADRPEARPRRLRTAVELAARLHTSGRGSATGRQPAADYLPTADFPTATTDWINRASVGPTHGDLGPWNLRVDQDDRVSLIDWEDYRPDGLPALDVLNLVLTAALIAYPDYPELGFDRLFELVFHEQNAFRDAADQALRHYAARTGQQVEGIIGLTPVFCRWMIRRIERQGRPTGHLFYGPFADRFEAELPRWNGGGRD
ncbi:hypothetical protein ABIA32_002911 [Streptacidiphilus sp. MAP12-20]|uniref:phosphotransferase family protein n=1 Tax=Streptacidiphilus sp. MAP12-20 TaxID=3156299 RepID=UPI003514BAC3